MSMYPTTESAKLTEEVSSPPVTALPSPDPFMELMRILKHILIAERVDKPSTLTQLNGNPVVQAGQPSQFTFRIDDSYVPVFAISIVNSSTATQYVNMESPASVVTIPIAAGTIFSYNLTQVKRIWIYSAAGVTVYPFPGQNVGENATGLYIQAWSNSEWKDMKGQGA